MRPAAARTSGRPRGDPRHARDPAEGLPLLAAAGEDRTVKWEAVLMPGSAEVIAAARAKYLIEKGAGAD